MKRLIMRIMRLFFLGVSAFIVLVVLTELSGYIRLSHKRNLTEFPVQGIGYFPYERKIPVKRLGRNKYTGIKPDLCIHLQEHIPGSIGRDLEYYREKRNILIAICWSKWSFFSAKESFTYEITSPEIRDELIRLIEEKYDLFMNADYESAAYRFARDHADKLREIGNGNRFLGMQRIGFYEWFRSGKDPEVELEKYLTGPKVKWND